VIAYLDCSTGVSGDKFLGALIDAGFDPEILRATVRDIGLPEVDVVVRHRRSGGVAGVGLDVTEPGAPRRHWAELREILSAAPLPEPVRAGALRSLGSLALAEARVHGVPVDHVHFHEIGAADTLVDVVGVALGLHTLGITELVASSVAVGSGSVECAHGRLPVPAPATALLLEGMPVVAGAEDGELTTPTGAALLVAHVAGFGPVPAMTLRRIGVGCGTRDLGVPNVCRLLMGDPPPEARNFEGVVVLETNIDHLTAEELAHAADRLREAGAYDVWQTPVVMKKGRAATVLSALVSEDVCPAMAERMIAETGTLGVRVMPASRRLVERDVTELETTLGTARFKVSTLPSRGRVLRVESDDAARLAALHGLPVQEAARLLEAEAARLTGVQPMRQTPSANET